MSSNINDFINMGNEIAEAVQDAINKNDFSKLATDIKNTVTTATSSFSNSIYTNSAGYQKKTNYASAAQYNSQRVSSRQAPRPQVTCPFLFKRVSHYDGLAQVIFSSFPAATFFGFSIWMLAVSNFVMLGVCAALMGLSIFSICRGSKKLKLSSLFYKFGAKLWGMEYFKVSDLAQVMMMSDEEVHKSLKQMIKLGYLPRARFDSTESTLMITDNAYQLYLGAEKDRIAREEKENKRANVINAATAVDDGMPSKVREILSEGREYITFVHGINKEIPDTDEMSTKLYHLEDIMNKIFEQVKKEPQSADELHKLMTYYLPTTKKLLQAYVELEKQNHSGENIVQTKKEIESAIDTINVAFENLLDNLFQDMAWDISSDISVMKTMMAQDGLTTEGQGMAMQMKK